MKTHPFSRFLALMLALTMVLSMCPVPAHAAEIATWTKVDPADVSAADKTMVTMTTSGGTTYALDTAKNSKGNVAHVVSVSGNTVTTDGTAAYGWTVTPVEGGYTLSVGELFLYTIDTNDGLRMGDTQAVWALDGDYLTTTDTGSNQRWMGVYEAGSDWRAYKNTTGNTAGQALGFYKLTSVETVDPTDPSTEPTDPSTDPSTEPTDPSEPAIVTIAEALAGESGAQFTIKGVVTLVDGRNIYLEDSTDAMAVYMAEAPADIALGDTIIATGTRGVYNGLQQLSDGTYEKSEGLTLTARETTVGALTTADVAHYVKITGLEITAVNGTALTLQDAAGASVVTYKSVLGDTAYAVGDTIDFTGAVGIFKTTLQLRNTLASEIVKVASAPGETDPTDPSTEPTGPVETDPTQPSDTAPSEPAIVTIAEALAGESGAEFTVKGVVTLVDGKNIYLQDSTGAMCVYMAATPADIALGDTIIGTGKRGEYNGLQQLSGGTYEKSEGLTLTARPVAYLSDLTEADVASYVSIPCLEITAVSGTTLTLKDGRGNTMKTYKSVLGDTAYAVGDMVNFTGAVGIFKTTLQLRNTLATEFSAYVEPEHVTIAEALAGESGAEFTVKGVVTLVDGKNIYIEDATDAMCVYMAAAPGDIILGDTIIATGKRGVYNGLEQLSSGAYVKGAGLTLTAREVTVGALTTADVAHYVKITGLEITAVNGTALTLKDAAGSSIVTYKSVLGDTAYAVGDTIDFTGAVGIFKTTLQLRNTLASEIVLVSSATPDPTDPTTPSEPEGDYTPIADALAGADGASFTVKGVVTLVDGSNIYLQDETGAICVRMSSKPTDIALGDTVIGTGSKTSYNGLPQLGSGTYEKSEGLTLTAKVVTDISTLTTADICTYIQLVGMEITEVYDNNGEYSTPNITVKDANGNKIQLYKAVTTKGEDGTWDWKVGDMVSISGGLSVYKTTLQLRNTLATEIEAYSAVQTGKVTSAEQFTSGTYVMVVETGYAPGVLDGTWITAVQPAIVGDKVTDPAGGIWTLTVNGTDVELCDSNGTVVAPKGGNNNGIQGGAYQWTWAFDEAAGTFTFSGKDADTVVLASNKGSENKFRAYKTTTAAGSNYPHAFTLYKVDANAAGGGADLPEAGSQVVIYNVSAKGVLAEEGDNQVINGVLAEIVDDVASPANGGVVFTVEANGDYFRFFNETYGYLCSNGTGNNAFYSLEASEDADWKLSSGKKGGFNLESRTAKFNGKYSQYLEYYSDSYKTYSMYNVTDYDIYEFFFYPVAEGTNLSGGIVNVPTVIFADPMPDAFIGTDYTFTFEVDAVFGIDGELTVKAGEDVLTAGEDGSYTIPAEKVVGESLTITVSGRDTKGVEFTGTASVTVRDEPVITNMIPEAGAETGDEKRPGISAEIINAGENAVVTMTVAGEAVEAVYAEGIVSYTPEANLADGRVTVVVTVTREDGKTAEKAWTFTVGKAKYQLYFGQLHSHTTYSDGSGSLESALEYIAGLPESANVDFVAFTDHSNYFDSKTAVNPEGALYDTSLATAESMSLWNAYVGAALNFNAEQNGVIAVPGYEMTWSGGPGHMNTFNTPGIVSRNNSVLNNKTSDAGMKAYYSLLSQPEGANTINQFNHPGSTFGTFSDFAYWDAVIDSRIQLVEVGNGEGQVGAGGYFPSYAYYTMALDKGWHVAPTNNQDNHKGKWGNANDARDVILTDDFSLEGIYQAIRDRRVYATEDKNLEVYYTVNGYQLGSSITEVPSSLNVNVRVYDPDVSDSISKVEVIVNSGKVAHSWSSASELATGDLSVTLAPNYSYYYIRVTQGDGDIAVTAPVWVGESLKLGISDLKCGTSTPVTGEELTLTTTLFNSEKSAATVKSITYSVKGGEVIGTDTTGYTVPASSTLAVDFKYVPTKAKVTTITATVVMEQDGQEYVFTMDIQLDIQDADSLVYIGIDASHYNEYVAGNYKDSMGNFSALAAEYSVRTVQLNTSEDLIAACSNPKFKALILTAPSRRLAAAQSDPRIYTEAEIAAIKAFNEAGGMVILAGWSDNYENYPVIQDNPDILHMAAAQNAVLEGLGSSLRIADDATYDDSYNGGQAYRLYFSTYGTSFLTAGVEVDPEHPHDRQYTEVFSHYGGASVYTTSGTLPSTVTPVVFGHATTYSVDVDKDGLGGNVPMYPYAEGDNRLMAMATEQLPGKGLIVVSGAAFMSNFEVQATIEDNNSEKNYSNYRICENLLAHINPVTISSIAAVQAEKEEGIKFTIQGVVTSNASGYDKRTAFFDCIYLQDSTAGINAFPVAGNFKIGDLVQISGTTSSYNGERQIAVDTIKLISENNAVEPMEVTAAQINDGSVLGSLITLKGTVTSFALENGLVQTIMVRDSNGEEARVFIDGYICTDKDVENLREGCEITVTGLASYDDSFAGIAPRIRIRNREDVVCKPHDCAAEGHSVIQITIPAKEPTDTEPGNKEFQVYACEICGTWLNENGEILTEEEIAAIWAENTIYVQTAQLALMLNGQEVQGTKQTWDLYADGYSMALDAVAQPVASNPNVTWSTSNKAVATADNGVVTFLKTGTVKITAKTNDGSNLTATVEIKVIFRDAASAFTGKKADFTNIYNRPSKERLQVGDSMDLLVFGTDKQVPLEGLTYEIISGAAYAQLEGNTLTALVAGKTVKVKAFYEGDPLKRSVTFSIKTKDMLPAVYTIGGVDELVATEKGYILTDGINAEGVLMVKSSDENKVFDLTVSALNYGGAEMDPGAVTWRTSNSSKVTVKNGVITVKKGTTGTVTITATSKLNGECKAALTVQIVDYTPSVVRKNPTINSYMDAAEYSDIIANEADPVVNVEFAATRGDMTGITVELEDGKIAVRTDSILKNGTRSGKITLTTENGNTFTCSFSISVSNKAPTVTIRTSRKLNLWDENSYAEITVTSKQGAIADISVAEMTFDRTATDVNGVFVMTPNNGEANLDKYGKITVWVEGCRSPVTKVHSIGVEKVRNKTVLENTTITLSLSDLQTAATTGVTTYYVGVGVQACEITATSTQGQKLNVAFEDGIITASFLDLEDLPKAGSYKFTIKATAEDGTVLKNVTLTVKVVK